ncbi:hypothetical protein SM124_15220 [Bacillus sp. 31A1R]|uniref:Uncharacterized protein n=1 Tax=Robertmurraya mangrovi TaxID=3098077 RepID=A0ABU5J0X4_9BACI|nr:hypothetical protein [Bacillus sp. 31A1R]MDZ5473068.1 hypothetical protein [Bacillus sp. 31A1R]
MDLSNEIKRIMNKYPTLSAIALTIFIWYGSFYLGNHVGEFLGNLKD